MAKFKPFAHARCPNCRTIRAADNAGTLLCCRTCHRRFRRPAKAKPKPKPPPKPRARPVLPPLDLPPAGLCDCG